MSEAEEQKAVALAADAEAREQLFLDYHGGTAWARAKIASGTLYLSDEAVTYMRNEVELRKAETARMEQIRKEDNPHHGHEDEFETRPAESAGGPVGGDAGRGGRNGGGQAVVGNEPDAGRNDATDGVQSGQASDHGYNRGPAAWPSQSPIVAPELRPAVGGNSAVSAPAADQTGDGAKPGKAGKHRAARAGKGNKAP